MRKPKPHPATLFQPYEMLSKARMENKGFECRKTYKMNGKSIIITARGVGTGMGGEFVLSQDGRIFYACVAVPENLGKLRRQIRKALK